MFCTLMGNKTSCTITASALMRCLPCGIRGLGPPHNCTDNHALADTQIIIQCGVSGIPSTQITALQHEIVKLFGDCVGATNRCHIVISVSIQTIMQCCFREPSQWIVNHNQAGSILDMKSFYSSWKELKQCPKKQVWLWR